MEKRLITGNEAVALAALQAGVKVVTGYPGTPSTGCLESLLAKPPAPGRHVEWSVNEKVALEIAAGAAWAGQRSLCTMKMSGVNVAYDSLCSIAYSGVVGGLVIYVADDPGASAGMVEQDSRGFALLTDLPMLEPATVAETYALTQAAFTISERTSAPVFVRLVAGVANAYAPVAIDDAVAPAERPPVLERDISRFTKAGAAICLAQHRAAIGRLAAAGQVVAEMGLNKLYLAPRPPRVDPAGKRVIAEAPAAVVEAGSRPDRIEALLEQAQDLIHRHEEMLPEPVQDLLRQAEDVLLEAQVRRKRRLHAVRHQAEELLRQVQSLVSQAQDTLGEAEDALPLGHQTLHPAQELLRLAEHALAQAEAEPPAAAPPVAVAAPPARPAEHPLRREGLGIIAAGAAAAYVDEGLALVAGWRPEHWPGFEPANVSVLRVAAVNPFPHVEVQALLRHCGTVIVLEELEPFLEQSVILEAHALDFDGRIIGKLDGTYSRIGEYGVGHVARGIAAALDLAPPDPLPHGATPAESLAAARPITVCAGCPHRGTFLAINQALRKLRYKPGEVMVTGDIGCTILGMNPPFNTVWNEVSMGASIPLAQGYIHAGVQTPVIATIGDSTFFHGGIPGLINAVQHQAPLTLIIMDNGWTAMTGMQVNPGTAPGCQAADCRRVDIARLVPALGVEHFFTMDPFDLAGSAATIQAALKLPGVKVILARQECAIQAMRRGLRAGAVRVVAEQCNACKLCISVTGCPAISLAGDIIAIDPALCYGCGLCVEVCQRDAIVKEEAAS